MPTDEEAHGAMARLSELLSLPGNWQNNQDSPDLAIDDTEQYQIAELWNPETDTNIEVWLLGPDRVQPHYENRVNDPEPGERAKTETRWGSVYTVSEAADHLNSCMD